MWSVAVGNIYWVNFFLFFFIILFLVTLVADICMGFFFWKYLSINIYI